MLAEPGFHTLWQQHMRGVLSHPALTSGFPTRPKATPTGPSSTTTIVVGTERVKTRGKWRTVEVLACPVTWRPHPEQIASARRGYEDWWQALGWIRDGLIAGGMLLEVELTAAMPKVRPWLASSRK